MFSLFKSHAGNTEFKPRPEPKTFLTTSKDKATAPQETSLDSRTDPRLPKKATEKTTPDTTVNYQNQLELVKAMGLTKGICAELTSAYGYDRISESNSFANFVSGDKDAVHNRVERLIQKADRIDAAGHSVNNMAFTLSNTPYKSVDLDGDNVTYEKLRESMGTHNFVSFPAGQQKTHIVYVGKEKNALNRCTLFDANMNGFKKKGSCANIQKELIDTYESLSRDEDWMRVTRSIT